MTEQLDRLFFPFVIKPGRYAGGEPGQIVKTGNSVLSTLLAFPERYEFGQSQLSLQVAYHLINSHPNLSAERAFAPDRDAEQFLRDKNLQLFSLETRKPAASFDMILFILPDWSVYTTVLQMLDLAGLPLRAKDREESYPTVLGIGPATLHPAPISPFFDLFLVGEFEDQLVELLSLWHQYKNDSKASLLARVDKQFESIYVPSLPSKQVKAAVTKSLKAEYYPDEPLQPLIEISSLNLPLEIGRNARPNVSIRSSAPAIATSRVRTSHEVKDQVERQLTATGLSEVALLTPPDPEQPASDTAVASVARLLDGLRGTMSLPMIQPGAISPTTLAILSRVRKSSLTLAVEAGTERLRGTLGVTFSDQELLESASLIFEKGWHSLRLYFQIGLPTETTDDLQGIISLATQINSRARQGTTRKNLVLLLSPFIPKPHTPFQWDELIDSQELKQRVTQIRRKLDSSIVIKQFGFENASVATALTRGDNTIADTIERAYRSGARFDGDFESFDSSQWQQAFEDCSLDLASCRLALSFGKQHPWQFIDTGVTNEQLQNDRAGTSFSIRTIAARPQTASPILEQNAPATASFGRSPKKIASKLISAPTRNCIRIRWGKTARYRYMSHLDNLRFLERLIRKAKLPVAWSQGDHPTMKLSVGPPLPLGFTSEAEYLDITLETNFLSPMLESFRSVFPEGFDLFEANIVMNTVSLSAALNRVVYELPVTEWDDAAALHHQIAELNGATSLPFERDNKGEKTTIDLRSAVYDISRDDRAVKFILGIGDGGYARPVEVISFLRESLRYPAQSLPFHRRRLYRADSSNQITDPMSL